MKKFRHLLLFVTAMMFSSMVINAQGPIDPTLNLAKGKPSFASSNDNNAKEANDGNLNSRWESAHSADGQYWYVDLEDEYVINKLKITWEGAFAKHYKIQTALVLPADPFGDEGWNDFFEETDKASVEPTNENFAPTAARYVRFHGIERAMPPYGYSFFEFEVYGIAEYDPSGSDDLTYVTMAPSTYEMSVGDNLQFVGYPLTGKGFIAEGATIGWSCTGETTDIDATTGLYSPTVGGEQTVTYTATAGSSVSANATVTVNAPRELAEINIKFASDIYGINEVGKYTIETFDQYGDPIVATLNFDAAKGTIDSDAKTYTPSEQGDHTIKVSGENGVFTTVSLTVIEPLITPADFTATSSSSATDPTEYPASNAIDGNVGTRWKTADGPEATPVELVIDLGAAYDLSMIAINWEGANAKDYTVEVASSEAGPYTVVGGENLGTGFNAHIYQLLLSNTGVQFIKINCTEASSGYGYSIHEVSVYGVSGTTGIGNNSVDGAMNVYCANKTLNIQGADVANASVYSLQGKLVLSTSNTNTVDVSSLANGLYIVNVKDVDGNNKAVKVQVK